MQRFNKPVAAICLAVASAFVQAQTATYDFDIPAQPAGQVLDALAKQTGLQPFYAEGTVKGVQSPGVKGKYSLRKALDKVLAGTGLTYQFTGEKAVAIKAAEKVAELAAITVTSSAAKDATVGYQPKRSFAGTKTDTPLLETPMAVQVVARELMDDQKATTVKSALDTVSAVRPQTTLQNGADFLVRGFTQQSPI